MAVRSGAGGLAGGAPQYALLAKELLRGIGAGEYPVGSLLPTEAELCRRYAVSRITARAAMRELQSRGLVSRRAGVGTRVEQSEPLERFVHVSNSVDAILQFTADSHLQVVSQETVTLDAARAEALHCAPGQVMLAVVGLRIKDRRPAFCLTRFHFPAVYAGVAAHLDGHRGSVMLLMEKLFGVRLTEMQQVIEAQSLSAGEARLLDARPREAALVTRRWHLGENGRLFIASKSIYPHQRYSYALRMRRQDGDQRLAV
jgi:DNA-binding GntR family transcriptional regulator